LEVSRQTIISFQKGRSNPSIISAFKIARLVVLKSFLFMREVKTIDKKMILIDLALILIGVAVNKRVYFL